MFVLKFDSRPDGGPDLCGPFPDRETAFSWASEVCQRPANRRHTIGYEAWPVARPDLTPIGTAPAPAPLSPDGRDV